MGKPIFEFDPLQKTGGLVSPAEFLGKAVPYSLLDAVWSETS